MKAMLAAPPRFRCTSCGSAYESDAWHALAKIRTLSGEDVLPYVVEWPAERVVEVRACKSCGRAMARTARLA